jgi:hypothetical protein
MRVVNLSRQPAATRRKRRVVGLTTAVACLALTVWIVRLAVALPSYQAVTQWRSVWVGFDVLELAAGATTGWRVTRRAPSSAVQARSKPVRRRITTSARPISQTCTAPSGQES